MKYVELNQIDIFGPAGSVVLSASLNQSDNNRKRKSAFVKMVKLLKLSGMIPLRSQVKQIGLSCNNGGRLVILVGFEEVSRGDNERQGGENSGSASDAD